MRKSLSLLIILLSNFVMLRAQTPNIDFETGTYASWRYYVGSCCPIVTPTGGTSTPFAGQQDLTSGGATDPYGGFPIVSPWGGNYSLKLGNDATGSDAERARYYVHIPTGSSSYSLIYHYAVVLNDPGHTAPEQPQMVITAFDSATGAIIPCDSFYYIANSALPGFLHSSRSSGGGAVYYKPWTMGNLKLNGFGGRTIAVDFASADCGYGGHFGYGYVDMTAGLFANTITSTCAGATVTLTGPSGYSSYSWRDSATFSTIYGTSQNVTLLTPGSITTYAVILTPYSGYGCPDTLYTRVIPLFPCSGTPGAGSAYAYSSTICGDPDTLLCAGFSAVCGLSYQWESSPDDSTWTAISGATSYVQYYSRGYTASYYRCIVTCIASGISTASSSIFVPALTGPGLYAVVDPPDTMCDGAEFYVSTCGTSTAYSVATWYGDGTADTTALTTTGVRHADIVHHYGYPGTYTVRHLLYDGTLLVDSAVYTHTYLYCSTFPITFYYDADGDCIKDPGETNWLPVLTEIDSAGVPLDTVSALSGFYYKTLGAPGTQYTFKVLSISGGLTTSCPTTGIIYDTVLPYVNMYSANYFGLECPGGSVFDLEVLATERHALFLATCAISVRNLGCVPTATTLKMSIDPHYTFAFSSPAPASVTSTEVTWNLGTLAASDPRPAIISYYLYGVSTSAGDSVHTTYTVLPISGDWDTTNNILIKNDTILASCDPNYIEVTPQGYISSGTNLRYTIHFENTGTDTAFNIHVMDTISNLLDVHSMRMVGATHAMDLYLTDMGSYTIAKFDFPRINLLDSSHHGLCDGFFTYTINTQPGLAPGTIIPNRAGIYFDTNPVVMTNTVDNIIGYPATTSINSVNKDYIRVFPNPANDELTIKTEDRVYSSFSITNTIEQTVMQGSLNGTQTKLNIRQLPAGVYYISLKGEYGSLIRKFVKM